MNLWPLCANFSLPALSRKEKDDVTALKTEVINIVWLEVEKASASPVSQKAGKADKNDFCASEEHHHIP